MHQFSSANRFISVICFLLIFALQSVNAQVDKIDVRSINAINHLLNGGGTWSVRGVRIETLDDLALVLNELEEYRKKIGDDKFYNGILHAASNEQDAAVVLWIINSMQQNDNDIEKNIQIKFRWMIENSKVDDAKQVIIPQNNNNGMILLKTTLKEMLDKAE
jgi:hypothetical protein